MARTKGSLNLRTKEFGILYDEMVEKYGDPVEVLFKIAKGRYKPQYRVAAANALLPYKYPKKQVEAKQDAQGDFFLTWDMPEESADKMLN